MDGFSLWEAPFSCIRLVFGVKPFSCVRGDSISTTGLEFGVRSCRWIRVLRDSSRESRGEGQALDHLSSLHMTKARDGRATGCAWSLGASARVWWVFEREAQKEHRQVHLKVGHEKGEANSQMGRGRAQRCGKQSFKRFTAATLRLFLLMVAHAWPVLGKSM